MHYDYFRKGQSFLGLVVLIGGIISVVGLLVAFLANSFIDTGYGLAASINAEAVAISGAQDALLQLDRNTNFSYASPGYPVVASGSTAMVTVNQNTPAAGYITVISTATVLGHTRTIDAVLSKNSSTTQMSVVSWQDVQ
jgi:hypothetical protein